MLFLIDYDRSRGQLVALRSFSGSERDAAEEARLELELDLNRRGIEREVALLEADSESALRKTHRRYFETLSSLKSPSTPLAEST